MASAVRENEILQQWRFGYLNECPKKEDNTENYHNEIKRGYHIYRKEN